MKTKYLTISLLALIAATFLLNPAAFAFEKGRCEGSWDMKKHQHEKKMRNTMPNFKACAKSLRLNTGTYARNLKMLSLTAKP